MKIGRGAVPGIGSVAIKDVPDGATVAGSPARPIEPRPRIFKPREGDPD